MFQLQECLYFLIASKHQYIKVAFSPHCRIMHKILNPLITFHGCRRFLYMKFDDTNPFFQYDNILMEEAAQILEIETFIPLLLQV